MRGQGLLDLAQVKPPHVAAYVEMLGQPGPEGQGAFQAHSEAAPHHTATGAEMPLRLMNTSKVGI